MLSMEDIDFYNQNKPFLKEYLNKIEGGKISDITANKFGAVGLCNHGGTCYLNSLLQYLFHDRSFRESIYKSPTPDVPAIYELQSLFANLELSLNSFVGTKSLREAFGWTDKQRFEQHDIHELFSVLIDALSQTSNELKQDISMKFRSEIKDCVKCPSCSFQRESVISNISFSIDVPTTSVSSNISATLRADDCNPCNLSSLLRAHSQPELLDADNQWRCSNCSNLVRATKVMTVEKLSKRLVVHLKRFRYDQATRVRVKLPTLVAIPLVIDTSDNLLSHLRTNSGKNLTDTKFRLKAVILHIGSANGGHYKTYVRRIYDNKKLDTCGSWVECNDEITHHLTREEEIELFGKHNNDSVEASLTNNPCVNNACCELETQGQSVYLQENAYFLVYEQIENAGDEESAHAESAEIPLHERSLIPSTILQRIDAENEEIRVLKKLLKVHKEMLDVTVYFDVFKQTETNQLRARFDSTYSLEKCSISCLRQTKLIELLQQVYENYRQCVASANDSVNSDEANSIDVNLRGAEVPNVLLLSRFRLRLYNDKTRKRGETYGSREQCTLAELGIGAQAVIGLGLASASVTLVAETRTDADDAFTEFDPLDIHLRLSLYALEGLSGPGATCPVHSQSPPSTPAGSTADSESAATAASGVTTLPTDATEATDTTDEFDRDSNLPPAVHFRPLQIREVIIPNKANATVLDLRKTAATYAKLCENKDLKRVVLIWANDREVVELTSKDDNKLLREFPIHSGEDIAVDIIPATAVGSYASPVLTRLQEKKQRICIYFNDPADTQNGQSIPASNCSSKSTGPIKPSSLPQVQSSYPDQRANTVARPVVSYPHCIQVSHALSLFQLRANIAVILSLPSQSFHFKRSAAASQIKDEGKSLADLGLVDQSILHLQLGPGCQPGEIMFFLELHTHIDQDTLQETGVGTVPIAVTPDTDGTDVSVAKNSTNGKCPAGTSTVVTTLGDFPVIEKLTILALKDQLFNSWDGLLAAHPQSVGSCVSEVAIPKPASRDHIRLRDGKTSQASAPLRNDRIVNRCMLGLADGRRLVVQVLPEAEIIGPDDVIIFVRTVSYGKRSVSEPVEIPVPRSYTVNDLYELIVRRFPQLLEGVEAAAQKQSNTVDHVTVDDSLSCHTKDGSNADNSSASSSHLSTGMSPIEEAVDNPSTEPALVPAMSRCIALAKGFTSGPPLTIKSSLKLKWNESSIIYNSNTLIDRPPLNLRDSSVVIVRSIAEYEKARQAAKATKESEISSGVRPATAGGTGLAAVRARTAAFASRASVGQGKANKENGLVIIV